MEEYILIPSNKKDFIESHVKNNIKVKCLETIDSRLVVPIGILRDFNEYLDWNYEVVELGINDLKQIDNPS